MAKVNWPVGSESSRVTEMEFPVAESDRTLTVLRLLLGPFLRVIVQPLLQPLYLSSKGLPLCTS